MALPKHVENSDLAVRAERLGYTLGSILHIAATPGQPSIPIGTYTYQLQKLHGRETMTVVEGTLDDIADYLVRTHSD